MTNGNPNATFSGRVRRMLGLSLDSWNNLIVVFAVLIGVFTLLGGVATFVAYKLQKQETQEARDDLERYKALQATRTASLEAEAANAKLATEKLKSVVQWRTFSSTEAEALTKALSAHPGSVNLRYMDGDPEALFLAIQVSKVLDAAGWKIAPGAVKPAGTIVIGLTLPNSGTPDADNLRAAFNSANISFFTNPVPPSSMAFNISEIAGAPELMVGSRAPITP